MTAPRFQKGQLVVVHGSTEYRSANGTIATVVSVVPGSWDVWAYFIDPCPVSNGRPWAESRLRPYDPPASWDDELSVWKPEALKDRTGETV